MPTSSLWAFLTLVEFADFSAFFAGFPRLAFLQRPCLLPKFFKLIVPWCCALVFQKTFSPRRLLSFPGLPPPPLAYQSKSSGYQVSSQGLTTLQMAYVGQVGFRHGQLRDLRGPLGRTPRAGRSLRQDGLFLWHGLSADDKYTLNFNPPMATHPLPPRAVTPNPNRTVILTNLAGPLTTQLSRRYYVLGPVPPQGPLGREAWDGEPAPPVDHDMWATARMVELSPEGLYPPGAPVPILGLPPWSGPEILTTRERQWVWRPVLRLPLYQGTAPIARLALRAQYRESYLVTRAGAQPPVGYECGQCSLSRGVMPWGRCISGGIGRNVITACTAASPARSRVGRRGRTVVVLPRCATRISSSIPRT